VIPDEWVRAVLAALLDVRPRKRAG